MSSRAPRVLRLAMVSWPRRDRAETGEVVLDTAVEFIEAGGTVAAQARGFVRTGFALRGRRLRRDFVIAPWHAAARLFVIAVTLTVVSLLVSHAGWSTFGRQTVLAGGEPTVSGLRPVAGITNGRLVEDLVLLAALAAGTLMLFRRYVAAAVVLPAAALLVAVAYERGYGFGQTAVSYVLRSTDAPHTQHPLGFQTGIDLSGLVGWLFACATVASVALAISARGRSDRRAVARPSVAGIALWLAAVVIAGALVPALSSVLHRTVEHGFTIPGLAIVGREQYPSWGATLSVWAFAIVAAVAAVAAVGLRRRHPAAALGAVLVGAALWIPIGWMSASIVYLIDETLIDSMVWGWWLFVALAGIALWGGFAVAVGRRAPAAARAERRQA